MMHQACISSVLTYQLPTIEVHAGQFAIVWLSNMDVQGLALINVGTAICCHLEDGPLGDFPHSFIQLLQIIRDLCNILWTSQDVFKCLTTKKLRILNYSSNNASCVVL